MRGAAARRQPHAQNPSRRRRQPAIGRLAIDEESAGIGDRIRRRRAVTAALLADNEQHADPALAALPKAFGRGHLRRENPFRIAGAAPNQAAILDAAGKERRHAIEVRREDNARLVEHRQDVGAAALDALFDDVVTEPAQPLGQPRPRFRLPPRRRVDVDECPREREDV